FTEEQIVGVLKEAEAGRKVQDVCRKHGISEHTFYRWKAKYGGLEISEARRLKSLEEENRRLKTLVADLTLANQMLKAVGQRKWGHLLHAVWRWGGCKTGSASASAVRAARSRWSVRRSSTARAVRMTRPSGPSSWLWQRSGGGLATAGSRCCSGGVAC